MTASLGTSCKNCSHPFNVHDNGGDNRVVRTCIICSCTAFEPDPCYWGHSAYCEHQDSPVMQDPTRTTYPCPATHGQTGVRCEKRPVVGSAHASHHKNGDLYWDDRASGPPVPQAHMAPLANPDRTQARDSQVGGNHYRQFKVQPWDVIDEYGLTFYAGNALKYLLRAGRKGVALEDLKKARHYLDRMIEIEEEKES